MINLRALTYCLRKSNASYPLKIRQAAHSIRFKIGILYPALLCLILIFYSAILYFNLSHIVYYETDKKLKEKAHEMEATINSYAAVLEPYQEEMPVSLKRTLHIDEVEKDEFLQWPIVKKIDNGWKAKIFHLGINHDYVLVATPDGQIVETSANLDQPELSILKEKLRSPPNNIEASIKESLTSAGNLRIITWPVLRAGEVKYIIRLATSIEPIMLLLRKALAGILITIPFILLFTTFLSLLFAKRTLKPIKQITEIARTINYQNMGKRVDRESADNEVKSLVDAFNNMIARLENTFQYIEQFSANASHELKTPLAIIRGESEVALRKERSAEEYKRVIALSIEETQRMLKIIDDLLLLARLDYRPEIFSFEEFDLYEFFRELYAKSRVIANEKYIAMTLSIPERPVIIKGDRLHLRRLFFNLLDNAIKFTPKNGRIEIKVSYDSRRMAVIAVSDTGFGISEEDLPRIFDRFFHSDKGTFIGHPTNGLGLSIAQSIAKIHCGSITVKSKLGRGSTFTVYLPLLQPNKTARPENKDRTIYQPSAATSTAPLIPSP